MPQWRKLYTKTIDSQDVADMPDDFTRLMWLMLPLVADSEGRMIGNTLYIRSKMFPLRPDVTPETVEKALAWYAGRGMIERYEVDSRCYIQITKFHEYQGKTDREAASVVPEQVKQAHKSRSRVSHDPLKSRSPLEESRGDAEERRGEERDPPPSINPTVVIQSEYETLLGRKLKSDEWLKQEATAAKSIGEYFTVEQLRQAYQHYKGQPFWADKRLTLNYLSKNMSDFLSSNGHGSSKPGFRLPDGV